MDMETKMQETKMQETRMHLRTELQRKPIAPCEADTRAHRAEQIF